jgi:nucleotide sugar dehydrogenase
MRVVMIGTGYVGLVSGTCFADFGHEVVCVDKNEQKIDQLNQGGIPIYEPGLDLLVAQNVKEGRLRFTTDLASTVADADVVFVAVGTPSRRGDGHADLTYVHAAVDEIADAMTKPTLVVTKSTVPVGTNRGIFNRLKARRPDLEPEVASNPEFLREGSAIEDFKRPDRVVVGAETEMAQKLMERLYRPLNLNRVPLMITGLETAELIKYAANAFLATKITFINEMADLCEKSWRKCSRSCPWHGFGQQNRPKVSACWSRLWGIVFS